ncbi:chondroitin sulfate N-acetylgalactosaminyltransferase 1 [Danio rerio]|uniref:Chondroitin sulfate N-acetylgalactosaminyltransferase 1 n=1 Tax=Danio rerio TaxID=7955 RepID=A0ACD6B6M3_DANRE
MRCSLRCVFWALLFLCVLLLYRQSCRIHMQSGIPKDGDLEQDMLELQDQHFLQLSTNLSRLIQELRGELRRSAFALPEDQQELQDFLHQQILRAESRSADRLEDEFMVLPFQSFSLRSVCQLETGLSRRPEEAELRPDRRNELNEALEAALHLLNQPEPGDSQTRRIYSPKHFSEGIFRTERDTGTIYDLAFREDNVPDFRRLVFFRPFAPLVKVREDLLDASQLLINIIVPLTNTVDTFRRFMQQFSEVCIGQDGLTHLTVVFFGSEKMEEVKGILDVISRRMKYRNMTLIHLNEDFSRSRALDVGARAWKHDNVLLFFCDVNVHFTAEFLNSCRINAQPGQKVFYPVMFSLYNPELLYGQHVPPAQQQMVVRKDYGFWKDDDFSTACLYRSDFMNAGGFGAFSARGSDTADLHLYRKLLHSGMMVVRAPSRGLFLMWHQTVCSSTEAFQQCVQNKALNEASHAQLGLRVFQKQIQEHLSRRQHMQT